MKTLKDYAKKHGLSYRTSYNHFLADKIPGAYQLPTGKICVPDENELDVETEIRQIKILLKEIKSLLTEKHYENN